MILSDKQILEQIHLGNIKIEPFNTDCIGSNSYDVHLSENIATYDFSGTETVLVGDIGTYSRKPVLDSKKHNKIIHFKIPKEGFIIKPGVLYLGSTLEYTETHLHVPFLEGKSSTGRLGINIHATAGKGDVGFCNHWTLEMSCIHPVKVYAGMPIGQIIYMTAGDCLVPYSSKVSAKYTERNIQPKESMMFKNKF
jgi:dCTP deaminase